MKVAVIGSRSFKDYERLKKVLDTFPKIDLIVSGGAKGADYLAEMYAYENNIPKKIFRPYWDKYGQVAGFRRNKDIVDEADIIDAFWDSKSRGTKHSIDYANKKNKKLIIEYF